MRHENGSRRARAKTFGNARAVGAQGNTENMEGAEMRGGTCFTNFKGTLEQIGRKDGGEVELKELKKE